MKKIFNTDDTDSRLLTMLVTPSWLSGVVAVVGALGIIIGTMLSAQFEGSSLQAEYLKYQSTASPANYNDATDNFFGSGFINNLPLLIFWALIGVVVYLFAVSIFNAVRHTAELKGELEYANVNRRSLLMQAGMHLAIRLVALIVWVAYINFFLHQIVPYCMAATLAGMSQITTWQGIGFIILAAVVLVLAIHLHAIMLRLIVLRPRIFTKALYVD